MEPFYPMAVSAVAVLATLVYASYLDNRDRRVPFIHWLPMLAVGVCCTCWLFWESTADAGLVVGYLSVVAGFLYADYLDNRGRTDSLGLTFYYRKESVFWYLTLVLVLPAVSWILLAPSFNPQLVAWYAMYAGILFYVTWMEYTGAFDEPANAKRKRAGAGITEIIGRWYFILIILVYTITTLIMLLSPGGWGEPALLLLLAVVFCGVFYLFGRMHLFGGADAWALIFISFCVPAFPFSPLFGTPPLGFLAFSVLINALLLNLAAPAGIFVINLLSGNRAPLMYMFFGFPVRGDAIQKEWGFVMEDFAVKNNGVSRKFIGFWDAIRRMYAGEGRVYTKDLREHPENYAEELALYRMAGTVWISYAVPFIIPITAGFISAVIFGDFLFAAMTMVVGG
jgi:preflagellin peptidase FlaK